jgi:hypothetical protein
MKKKYILFLAVILAAFTANAQEKTVEASVEKLRLLLVNPDKAALEALTDPNLSYGHSSGKIENQSEFIEALVSGPLKFPEVQLSNQSVSIVGKTAVVRHDFQGKTLERGRSGEVKIKVITVWVKQKKGWVLLARQAMR